MDRYCLQVLNFGEWEDEKAFRYPHQAIACGKEDYSQNQWRVYRVDNNETVYEHDPMLIIENEARLDAQRMADTARWRETFQNRAILNAASRQREVDRDRAQARINRLGGFNFIGEAPRVTNLFNALFETAIDWPSLHKKEEYKIDWRKEGF